MPRSNNRTRSKQKKSFSESIPKKTFRTLKNILHPYAWQSTISEHRWPNSITIESASLYDSNSRLSILCKPGKPRSAQEGHQKSGRSFEKHFSEICLNNEVKFSTQRLWNNTQTYLFFKIV